MCASVCASVLYVILPSHTLAVRHCMLTIDDGCIGCYARPLTNGLSQDKATPTTGGWKGRRTGKEGGGGGDHGGR